MSAVRRLSWDEARPLLDSFAPRGAPSDLFDSASWHAVMQAWEAASGRTVEFWYSEQPEGRLLIPWVRERVVRRRVPLPCLRLAAIPDSQFADVLWEGRPDPAPVCRALAEDRHWQVLEWSHLPEDARCERHLLPALTACAVHELRLPADGNAWIDLSQGWAAYYATRSRRLKKGNNHIRNRLQRQFREIAVHRWCGGDDEAQVKALLIRLSAASWKRETGLTLDRPAPRAFLDRLFAEFAPRGELMVWWLELDGTPAASELQLLRDGQVYALRADYDERFEAYSPGTYLFWQLLQALCEAPQWRRYWMGPGMNPYKARWQQGQMPLHRYRLYRRSGRGHWLHLLEARLIPWMRRLREGR